MSDMVPGALAVLEYPVKQTSFEARGESRRRKQDRRGRME
jgi:hypothetical protein